MWGEYNARWADLLKVIIKTDIQSYLIDISYIEHLRYWHLHQSTQNHTEWYEK